MAGWLTVTGRQLEAVCGQIEGLTGPRRPFVLALVETPFLFGFGGILKIIK